jgi:hypothetical protein
VSLSWRDQQLNCILVASLKDPGSPARFGDEALERSDGIRGGEGGVSSARGDVVN